MLREISGVRQDDPTARKRWFQDDYFDLYLWTDAQGALRSFQLGYERYRQEKVLSWDRARGYTHRVVDGGDSSPFNCMTPLLAADAGRFPKYRVISQFDSRAAGLEAALRHEIRARLASYLPRRVRRGACR
jgi:hypothetical protein